jgi:hypothetical protein
VQSLDIAYLRRPRLAQHPATLATILAGQLSCASSQQVHADVVEVKIINLQDHMHAAQAAFRHTIRNCLKRCMSFPLLMHIEAANLHFACQGIAQASTSCKHIEADKGMQHCS